MYLPRRFAESDLSALDALLQRDAFVTLISRDSDGHPFVSHLPVLYQRDGEQVRFRGHWARPNPQSRHHGPALLIVHGPHAYVSPRWYPRPADHVPTWNYAVAHIHGSLQPCDSVDDVRDIVSDLSAQFEGVDGSWQPQHGNPDFERDLQAIVGFQLTAERIELKFKLNQNHPVANRVGVIAGLQACGGENANQVAALMQARLPATTRD